MKNKKYLRVGEVAELLSVTPQTVRHYRYAGKIKGVRTPGGQTIYPATEIMRFLEEEEEPVKESAAHYARSSSGDKVLIENQFKKLRDYCGEPAYEIKDSGSGLNENRTGLKKLIRLAKSGEITVIRVTEKDRLSRFGNQYLEELFKVLGVKVEYVFNKTEKSPEKELMQDFMSLLASFSGKFYRLRGYREQRQLLRDAGELIDEKEKLKQGRNDRDKT